VVLVYHKYQLMDRFALTLLWHMTKLAKQTLRSTTTTNLFMLLGMFHSHI